MACSIEVRVPFLDNEVVEFLRRVPAKLKIHGHIQKYLLRKAMDGILPKEVLRRRKAAFGLPIRGWLRNELREMLPDMFSDDRIRRRGLFDAPAITKMMRQPNRRAGLHASALGFTVSGTLASGLHGTEQCGNFGTSPSIRQ